MFTCITRAARFHARFVAHRHGIGLNVNEVSRGSARRESRAKPIVYWEGGTAAGIAKSLLITNHTTNTESSNRDAPVYKYEKTKTTRTV